MVNPMLFKAWNALLQKQQQIVAEILQDKKILLEDDTLIFSNIDGSFVNIIERAWAQTPEALMELGSYEIIPIDMDVSAAQIHTQITIVKPQKTNNSKNRYPLQPTVEKSRLEKAIIVIHRPIQGESTIEGQTNPASFLLWWETLGMGIYHINFPFTLEDRENPSQTMYVGLSESLIQHGAIRLVKAFQEWNIQDSRMWIVRNGSLVVESRDMITWDQVFIDPEKKHMLEFMLMKFLSHREFYSRLDLPYRRGILLAGPPGNGKTMIIRALAAHATDYRVVTWILTRRTDADEMEMVFQHATEFAPTLLVIEDIDGILQSDIARSDFLNQLDGLGRYSEGIFCVATTNYPERMDPGLMNRPGRFDQVVRIGYPELDIRYQYLTKLFQSSIGMAGITDAFIYQMAVDAKNLPFSALNEIYLSVMFAMTEELDLTEALGAVIHSLSTEMKAQEGGEYPWKNREQMGFAIRNSDDEDDEYENDGG